MFQTKSEKNQNTRFMLYFFFLKSCHLWHNVEKYCAAEETTDNKWRTRITCSVRTARNIHSKMVARMCLFVMLYVHCLYFF